MASETHGVHPPSAERRRLADGTGRRPAPRKRAGTALPSGRAFSFSLITSIGVHAAAVAGALALSALAAVRAGSGGATPPAIVWRELARAEFRDPPLEEPIPEPEPGIEEPRLREAVTEPTCKPDPTLEPLPEWRDALSDLAFRSDRPPAEERVEPPPEPEPPRPRHMTMIPPPRPREGSAREESPSEVRGAELISGPRPNYPRASVRLGEEGTVVVRIHLAEDGAVSEVELAQSSGFRRLDESALEAVRRWRFRPATREGRAVPFRFEHAVEFSLRDR